MGTCIRSVFVEFTSRENALERLPRFGRKPTVFFSTVEYKSCLDSRPFCANDLIMVTKSSLICTSLSLWIQAAKIVVKDFESL